MVSDKEMTTFTSEKCGLYEKLVMKECVFVFLVYMKKKWLWFCDIRNNQGFGKCYHPRPRLITLIIEK